MIKISRIEDAVREFKHWISLDFGHRANIMLDKSSGEIWVDTFVDENSSKVYESKEIVNLSQRVAFANENISVKSVAAMAKSLDGESPKYKNLDEIKAMVCGAKCREDLEKAWWKLAMAPPSIDTDEFAEASDLIANHELWPIKEPIK